MSGWQDTRPGDQGNPDGNNATIGDQIAPGGIPQIGKVYRIPPRQGRAVVIAKGRRSR